MGMKHVVTDLTTGEVKIEDIPADVDPGEWMQTQMDNCPLCNEARARGEVPHRWTHDDLGKAFDAMMQPTRPLARRPRWRSLKRKVR